jgi:hypothetical protein
MTKISIAGKDNYVVTRARYRYCPHCANFCHFTEKLDYCILCGTRMIDECPECREPIIYPTAKFCPACGNGLMKTTENEAQNRVGP